MRSTMKCFAAKKFGDSFSANNNATDRLDAGAVAFAIHSAIFLISSPP
jgi:hypothetical protein